MRSAHLLLCLCLTQVWGPVNSNSTLASESTPTTLPTTLPTTPTTTTTTTTPTTPTTTTPTTTTPTATTPTTTTPTTTTPTTPTPTATTTTPTTTTPTPTATTPTTTTPTTTTTTPTTTTKAPPNNVENVTVSGQNETSVTLKWKTVDDILTYTLQYTDSGRTIVKNINASDSDSSVEYVVSHLTAGTKYNFTLFTVSVNVRSTGYPFTVATAPPNAEGFKATGQNETSITLQWNKVNSTVSYKLQYDGKEIEIPASSVDGPMIHTVSPLRSGTKYEFTLFTVFGNVSSVGVKITAVTAPDKVQNVTVSGQNETSITLKWDKVYNILIYRLQYDISGVITTKNISATNGASLVEYVVSDLTAGTKYNFTLFAVFEGVSSTGSYFTAATAPPNAEGFRVTGQNETSITLQWNKMNNIVSYKLQYGDEKKDIQASSGDPIIHTVSPLRSGTEYEFTLFTVFEGVSSIGVNTTAVTAPDKVQRVEVLRQNETSITLNWDKVDNITTYRLQYNDIMEDINAPNGASSVEYQVLTLTAGTEYNFILFTVFKSVNSTGCNFTAVTAPGNARDFRVAETNDTSITLQWSKVNDIRDYVLLFNGSEINITAPEANEKVTHTVSPLMMGNKYAFTLFTVFEGVRSRGSAITAVTTPRNAAGFKPAAQNETSITLQWSKVNAILNYTLLFNGNDVIITPPDGELVTYTVWNLTAGTEYKFTLFTVFNDVRSPGSNITAVTAPLNVAQVKVTKRSVTSVTLQWNKVDETSNYTLSINGQNLSILRGSSSNVVTYEVLSLKAGTEYEFTLFTVFYDVWSRGLTDFTVTAIDCANSDWHVTNSSINGKIQGLFSNATATDGHYDTPNNGKVSLTGLLPGSTYEVSLWFIKSPKSFLQCQHNLTIVPPDLTVHCGYWAAGYAISLRWDAPRGVWTSVEVNVTGKNTQKVEGSRVLETQIYGFQPAQTYKVSVASLSGNWRSNPSILDCTTDPRGVIAGSVMAVLLLSLLVCLAVFISRRRPDLLRKKTYVGNSILSSDKYKAIPAGKFSDHFYQLSVDQNRGLSEEYEDFIPVGAEQTRKAAMIAENKAKNRFSNVLPYDWSRVKLTTVNNEGTSDYINANYMPGYGSNRQYIAAQGPLPNTINDFWRMIWEQRVKGVVMVTNCAEGGRPKCEQYWPLDYTPCLYGDLLVTVRSEQRTQNWTLREFGVKNKETSEQRTVKHFHFTAWPDHGVPEGTEALIHFRGLVREHIESEGTGTPTVVHCSAGVGRTGTIIALDVLLQQLMREKAVGIAAFVHKMRLSRPLMVQTESQYVFLHQCIMDSLEQTPTEDNLYENSENLYENSENLYENTDMIYANSTALREFQTANTNV